MACLLVVPLLASTRNRPEAGRVLFAAPRVGPYRWTSLPSYLQAYTECLAPSHMAHLPCSSPSHCTSWQSDPADNTPPCASRRWSIVTFPAGSCYSTGEARRASPRSQVRPSARWLLSVVRLTSGEALLPGFRDSLLNIGTSFARAKPLLPSFLSRLLCLLLIKDHVRPLLSLDGCP